MKDPGNDMEYYWYAISTSDDLILVKMCKNQITLKSNSATNDTRLTTWCLRCAITRRKLLEKKLSSG